MVYNFSCTGIIELYIIKLVWGPMDWYFKMQIWNISLEGAAVLFYANQPDTIRGQTKCDVIKSDWFYQIDTYNWTWFQRQCIAERHSIFNSIEKKKIGFSSVIAQSRYTLWKLSSYKLFFACFKAKTLLMGTQGDKFFNWEWKYRDSYNKEIRILNRLNLKKINAHFRLIDFIKIICKI